MNVALCDTSLRPLNSDFESAGVIDALVRLCQGIAEHYEMPDLPMWMVEDRLTDVVGSEAETGADGTSEMASDASGLVVSLAKLEVEILTDVDKLLGRSRTEEEGPLYCRREEATLATALPTIALARLLLGACCEAYASLACARIFPPGRKIQRKKLAREAQQLYTDSCKAAVWTSVHAQYLCDLTESGMAIAAPCIHSVPSELMELDLSDVYSKRTSPKSVASKETIHLLSLMARCTNPGSRGWDSIVKQSLEKSDGTRRIAMNALSVSLSGMHSCIHPAQRIHWKQRGILINTLASSVTTAAFPDMMMTCVVQFKECMRRMVSNCISSNYAMVAALEYVEHPVALLKPSPMHMPIEGLEASCMAFAKAGEMHVREDAQVPVANCILKAFDEQMRIASDENEALVQWNPGFLGKGTASIHQKIPAISVAADLWCMAFRCNFIPFWTHSSSHCLRAYRLDPVQYKAIHSLNAATNLTLLLSDQERMRLNRVALNTPAAGIMTLEEAAALLEIPGMKGSSCNGGSKGPIDALHTICSAGERNAARILTFCRMASISEEILVYSLGPETARMQATALVKRLLVDEVNEDADVEGDPLSLLHLVPEHSQSLCACIQCRRVANAHAADAGTKWRQPFTEIGTSSSMVSVDPDTRELHMRCAKRSSASLRTAVAFEEEMCAREIESDAIDPDAVKSIIVDSNTGSESGASARVRRDAKSSMEQRVSSAPCGCDLMLTMPIVGKVVRLWGEWYALCAYCGCMLRVHPGNRVGTEICCMRCDYRMLNRKEKLPQSARDAARHSAPRCRYCAKEDPQRSGAKWKQVRAPLDMTGKNAELPPPLRTVYFCPQHFRPWIPSCLKTMPMRIILSHIAYNAKPCYGMADEPVKTTSTKAKGGGAKRRKLRNKTQTHT